MSEIDRMNMIRLICEVFNYTADEVELWSDSNIYNAYLSAQKAIDDYED